MKKDIEKLSELRSNYSCFDEREQPYYHALSLGIEGIKALEQEPCVTMRDLSEEELKHFAEEMKKVRPQALEQEPKTGHWIEGEVWEDTDGGWGRWQKCSVCRQSEHHKTKFCPNCGAKMESEEV